MAWYEVVATRITVPEVGFGVPHTHHLHDIVETLTPTPSNPPRPRRRYLYVRMLCSPGVYGVPLDAQASDPNLMERRLDLAHSAASLLDRHGLIKYDRRTGNFQPTDLGR